MRKLKKSEMATTEGGFVLALLMGIGAGYIVARAWAHWFGRG